MNGRNIYTDTKIEKLYKITRNSFTAIITGNSSERHNYERIFSK